MTTEQTYTLPVGVDDEKRLQTLNNICNPHTLDFLNLSKIDLDAKVILDVGCGIGMLTMAFAKLVGPQGKVIAVDISEEQLALAKTYAAREKLDNIEFVCMSVDALSQLDVMVDFVYTRFLLEHLRKPYHALEQMNALLKPGGHLFCENIVSYEAMFCVPESIAYSDWRQLALLQPKLHDTDFFIGKKLYHHYLTLGIKPIDYQLQQPFIKDINDKKQFYMATQSEVIQELFAAKGYYTREAVLAITANVMDFMQQDVLVAFPQYIQIIGQKQC